MVAGHVFHLQLVIHLGGEEVSVGIASVPLGADRCSVCRIYHLALCYDQID